MKRILTLFVIISLFHISGFGQKKYQMVIEKTDKTEVSINTNEIVKTYFREINYDDITAIDPVEERLKPFIGYWTLKASDYYHDVTFPTYSIFFYQEGTCQITEINNSKSNSFYSWDYDESLKYLSIAGLSKGQWQITSIDDNNWSGLALYGTGDKAYAATRKPANLFIINRKWFTEDGIEAGFGVNGYFNIYAPHSYHQSSTNVVDINRYSYMLENTQDSPLTVVEDNANDVIKIQKEYSVKEGKAEEKRYYITIDIVHPYSYKDVYLNIYCRHYDATFSGRFFPAK